MIRGVVGLGREAVGAVLLPCSATIVVPALLLAVLGRGRWAVTMGAAAGLVIGAFTAVAWAPAVPDVVISGLLAVGAGIAAVSGRRVTGPVGAIGAATAGVAAGLLWRPCVGVHLGDALTTTVTSPAAGLVPVAAYVAVLTLPGLVLTGALRARAGAPPRWAQVVAAAGLGALAVTVALGWGDELTGALFRWSGRLAA